MVRKRYRASLIGLGRIADTIDDEVIGTGWFVPFSHMGSYMDVPEVHVVAGSDLYAEQREAFGRRWGMDARNLYESYEEMLEREQPDIVSICTSAAPRSSIVLDIARMVRDGRVGVKCLWFEKPISNSLADAHAMVAACRKAGIILMMNTMRASDVYYRRARALIDQGALGKMLQVTTHAGGNMSHMGTHVLGAMCLLAGSSGRVSWLVGEAESDAKVDTDDDFSGNAYLAFENGVRGFCRMMDSGPANWMIDAIGETGRIHVRNVDDGAEWELWRMGQAVEGGRPTPVRHIFPRPQRIWSAGVGQVKDAIACIETGKTPNCSGDMAVHLLEIAIALRQSHRQGNARIDLPLSGRDQVLRSAETLRGDRPRALSRPGDPDPTHVLAKIARSEGIGQRRPVS